MKGVAQQERGSMMREAAVHRARWWVRRWCTVLLHNNQPCLDAFMEEWGVMRGDKRVDERGEARQERDGVT